MPLTWTLAERWVDPALGFAVGWVSRALFSFREGLNYSMAIRTIFIPMRKPPLLIPDAASNSNTVFLRRSKSRQPFF